MKIIQHDNKELSQKAVALASFFEKSIKLGCDYKIINEDIRNGNVVSYYEKYNNVDEIYEKDLETLITHEFVHLLLEEKVSSYASHKFDEIDKNREITGLRNL